MQPFQFTRIDDTEAAILANQANSGVKPVGAVHADSQYLAGGTTLLDMMKLDVMRPTRIIDINALEKTSLGRIEFDAKGLRLGAMARMSDTADHAEVKTHFPVIAQALQLAASAQIRNMAALAGNVLQRTRCTYFRDTSYANCNKRIPSSGCAALEGINRSHAVLGTSEQCIAAYPGDFGQALIALDATVQVRGRNGAREIPFASLHHPPGDTPHIENTLAPDELIAEFRVPATRFARRSLFLKIRDRNSYEFALASAAVALELDGDIVKEARIALGGVATIPWRTREAEGHLEGRKLDEVSMSAAADAAFAQAIARRHNSFKIELGKRTLVRALRQAVALEI